MTESSTLLGLERVNLRQQAAVALRRAITSGELAPGTHLGETDLSARLQISRGTLREALRELQQEGLVVQAARGRLVVKSLTLREIHDVFTVRAALESLAAKLIVESDDATVAVGELELALERMAAVEHDDVEERVEADLDFHRRLCELSGNATLLTSWEALEGSIRMSIMYGGSDRGLQNMGVERHQEIVRTIASGDGARASGTITEHMEEAARTLSR